MSRLTVYVELGEAIDPARLAALPALGCRTAVLQRLGWLLDRAGWQEKTGALQESLCKSRRAWRLFDRRLPVKGNRDRRWNVVVNAGVQPDVER